MGIEKIIYGWVKKNPKIKNTLRDIYQRLFYFLPKKQFLINNTLKVREGYFFGFHDKIPWSPDNKFLLANRFHISNRSINDGDQMDVGIFSGDDFTEFRKLGDTRSFNWQQGCMLQWIGKKNNFIYNDFKVSGHGCIIRDILGNTIQRFPLPVAAVHPDGNSALSYNFARMAKYAHGYGYENGEDEELNVPMPEKEGLSLISFAENRATKLFSVKDIASLRPDKTMERAFHYFTHALFSPSGNRFVFFHRWIRDLNFVHTRMFSCNPDGSNLFQFPADGMVSHIAWQDDRHILAYCRTRKFGDAYTLFKDISQEYEKKTSLQADGHPSFSPVDSRFIITDTYPDRYRLAALILYDLLKDKRYDVVKLRQPLQYKNELRCDFHPRWNRDGNLICFDSAHTGTRSLCTINVADIIKNI